MSLHNGYNQGFPACEYCNETPPRTASDELDGKKICGWCRAEKEKEK